MSQDLEDQQLTADQFREKLREKRDELYGVREDRAAEVKRWNERLQETTRALDQIERLINSADPILDVLLTTFGRELAHSTASASHKALRDG